MFDLPLNLDCNPEKVPPFGMFRIVEETRPGRLVRIIGDFDLEEALARVGLVQYPYIRRILDDMGRQIRITMPGSDGVPNAGSES